MGENGFENNLPIQGDTIEIKNQKTNIRNMRTIKIWFLDFWGFFDPRNNLITKILSERYILEFDEKNPDYLFFSSYSYNHFKYKDCVKIYFTAENIIPDLNFADYGMGFHFIEFGDRYLRCPLYLLYEEAWNGVKGEKVITSDLTQRKFCNFMYSNSFNANPIREKFFSELSKYKKVDSAGKYLNNMGGGYVPNKLEFIKDYKFTIAIENSSVEGYTTEKIIEPMSVNSIPIYWGNKRIEEDFNSKSILILKEKSDIPALIEQIIYLDNDEDAYLSMLKEPWFKTNTQAQDWENRVRIFLYNIVDQPKELAIRNQKYGFRKRLYKEEARVAAFKNNYYWEKLCGLKERIFGKSW